MLSFMFPLTWVRTKEKGEGGQWTTLLQSKFRWREKWGVKRASNSLAWHCESWCSICYLLGKQKQLGASLRVLAHTSISPSTPVIYVWIVLRVFCLPGTWSLLERSDLKGEGTFRNTYAKIMGIINSHFFSMQNIWSSAVGCGHGSLSAPS